MITRSFLTVVVCYGFFIYIQTIIPKAIAKRLTDVKEYTSGEQRTRRRQNYGQEMALENELLDNIDDVGPPYEIESTQNEENKEDPLALIVDYANLLRNDIILLDNSVETRKRGKVEKYNHIIRDVPCSCEYKREIVDLGESYYPRMLENRTCSEQMCNPPYKCETSVYELTVLKRRTSERAMERSAVNIPDEFKHRWIAQKQFVTIGCMCVKDYIISN